MIPNKYSLLKSIGTLPKIVDTALQYLGVKEFVGKQINNPIIMNMAKQLDVLHIYKNDETSWCALFICFVLKLCGKPMSYVDYEILRAASFVGGGSTHPKPWGEPIGLNDVCLGDIVVFERPGGNHVAIAVAVSKNNNGVITSIHVIGGNQSNAVTFAEMPVERIIGIRRFYATGKPESAIQYVVDSTGRMSRNEA